MSAVRAATMVRITIGTVLFSLDSHNAHTLELVKPTDSGEAETA